MSNDLKKQADAEAEAVGPTAAEGAASAAEAEIDASQVEGGAESEDGEAEPAAPPFEDPRNLRIRLMERELADREQTLHEYIRAHKKAQADFEAFRERLLRDQEEQVEAARAKVVERLLDVHDNLVRTLDAAKGAGSTDSLLSGVQLVERQFLQRMQELGLVRYDPVGQPFDPSSMEALSMVPVDSPEKNQTVVATVKPGFRIGDREIRPASVVVGRFA